MVVVDHRPTLEEFPVELNESFISLAARDVQQVSVTIPPITLLKKVRETVEIETNNNKHKVNFILAGRFNAKQQIL